MGLFFGASAVLTPAPVTVTPGELTIQAPKPISSADDIMQVYISLGAPTDDTKQAVSAGKFGLIETGRIDVQVCKSETECLPTTYGGAFLTKDTYGIFFTAKDTRVRHSTFVAVKIRTAKPLPNATVRWQNYRQ